MFKQNIAALIRQLGLARRADDVRFQLKRLSKSRVNSRFKKLHPGVVLPPDYLVYESFQMDFDKYYTGGKEDAEWVVSLAMPYCNLTTGKILDWGCGRARIIRHLPNLLGPGNEYHGSDYNATTIRWCKAQIPGISFKVNQLSPPLDYAGDYFDLIYAISILTHLSRDHQQLWSDELFRVVSRSGVVILTTHGDAFMEKLTPEEQKKYLAGDLIVRDNVKEGHRMYGAFHPPAYIGKVFTRSGFTIAMHIPGSRVNKNYISQDVWILKK